MDKVENILLTAIAIERYGQEFYHRFADMIEDSKGKALMNGLGRDEKDHENVLSSEYQKHFERAPPKTIDIDLGMKAIREIFGSKKKPKKAQDLTLEILETGIIVEDESIKFYSNKSKKTDDDKVSKLLGNLVKIETEHKKMLEENLFQLKQDGTWFGYVPILEG